MSRTPRQHDMHMDAPQVTDHAPGALFAIFKRGLDIIGAVVGLILFAPLILCCAWWIKIVNPGPALYRQWRVGENGWLFRICKLRTMTLDAEAEGVRYAQANDPRILPGCVWMRRSHVDELPQLWNILWGQMSLVGPRPERPEMLEQLRPYIPHIDQRHRGRPGLTGLAQVLNGYTNDLAGAKGKLACDLHYLSRQSMLGEIRLLLRTVTKVWDPSAM